MCPYCKHPWSVHDQAGMHTERLNQPSSCGECREEMEALGKVRVGADFDLIMASADGGEDDDYLYLPWSSQRGR